MLKHFLFLKSQLRTEVVPKRVSKPLPNPTLNPKCLLNCTPDVPVHEHAVELEVEGGHQGQDGVDGRALAKVRLVLGLGRFLKQILDLGHYSENLIFGLYCSSSVINITPTLERGSMSRLGYPNDVPGQGSIRTRTTPEWQQKNSAQKICFSVSANSSYILC